MEEIISIAFKKDQKWEETEYKNFVTALFRDLYLSIYFPDNFLLFLPAF